MNNLRQSDIEYLQKTSKYDEDIQDILTNDTYSKFRILDNKPAKIVFIDNQVIKLSRVSIDDNLTKQKFDSVSITTNEEIQTRPTDMTGYPKNIFGFNVKKMIETLTKKESDSQSDVVIGYKIKYKKHNEKVLYYYNEILNQLFLCIFYLDHMFYIKISYRNFFEVVFKRYSFQEEIKNIHIEIGKDQKIVINCFSANFYYKFIDTPLVQRMLIKYKIIKVYKNIMLVYNLNIDDYTLLIIGHNIIEKDDTEIQFDMLSDLFDDNRIGNFLIKNRV
jgi:hypothetical protein